MTIAVIGVTVGLLAATRRVRIGAGLMVLAALGGASAGLLAGSAIALTWAVGRFVERSSASRAHADGDETALEVLSLGTAAGLSFHDAALRASGAVREARPHIDMNLRRRRGGLAPASGSSTIDQAFEIAGRSEMTGAAMAPQLRAQLADVRRTRVEARRTRLARLPVKLLFPLVFLTLPGFVLLTVVPAVVGGLSRLEL